MTATQLNNRPHHLSMEGHIYNADHVLKVALNPATKAVPAQLVRDCKGIAILSIVYAGAGMTVHYGSGILMSKKKRSEVDESGAQWSAPSAIMVGGYAMGAFLGAKVDSLLIFLMDDETLKNFVERPKTRMGLDAALAVGNLGGDASVANVGTEHKGTVAMAFTKGAFAGMGLQYGTLQHQEEQNEVFYDHNVSPHSILNNKNGHQVFSANSQVSDIYMKLALLQRGLTWVPSKEDLDRVNTFRNQAEEASRHFHRDVSIRSKQ